VSVSAVRVVVVSVTVREKTQSFLLSSTISSVTHISDHDLRAALRFKRSLTHSLTLVSML
jgi:hypothetical protein